MTFSCMCVFVFRPVYGDQGSTANTHSHPSTDWIRSQRYNFDTKTMIILVLFNCLVNTSEPLFSLNTLFILNVF